MGVIKSVHIWAMKGKDRLAPSYYNKLFQLPLTAIWAGDVQVFPRGAVSLRGPHRSLSMEFQRSGLERRSWSCWHFGTCSPSLTGQLWRTWESSQELSYARAEVPGLYTPRSVQEEIYFICSRQGSKSSLHTHQNINKHMQNQFSKPSPQHARRWSLVQQSTGDHFHYNCTLQGWSSLLSLKTSLLKLILGQ